jgi:hypothetical protein
MIKLGPVDLCLFAGQRAQAQIGFGFGPRPMAGNAVAEVIRAAGITALARHHVKSTGRKFREFL